MPCHATAPPHKYVCITPVEARYADGWGVPGHRLEQAVQVGLALAACRRLDSPMLCSLQLHFQFPGQGEENAGGGGRGGRRLGSLLEERHTVEGSQ